VQFVFERQLGKGVSLRGVEEAVLEGRSKRESPRPMASSRRGRVRRSHVARRREANRVLLEMV
jgi:hypothetical protein